MKPLSERIKDFPANQFVDWLCLSCVDVREVSSEEDAQDEINKIRQTVTERLTGLEQRAEAAEAKLAELSNQKPRYQIQKKPSYGRESVWIDVASRVEAENNLLHGYRWRMVYEGPAPDVSLAELVPDGWKLVPIVPTESMVIDGFESRPDESFSDPDEWEKYSQMSGCEQAAHRARLCWAAMLAAAPEVE